MPYAWSFESRIPWSIVSKALEKYKKSPRTQLPLSKAVVMLLVKIESARLVECFSLKPIDNHIKCCWN